MNTVVNGAFFIALAITCMLFALSLPDLETAKVKSNSKSKDFLKSSFN